MYITLILLFGLFASFLILTNPITIISWIIFIRPLTDIFHSDTINLAGLNISVQKALGVIVPLFVLISIPILKKKSKIPFKRNDKFIRLIFLWIIINLVSISSSHNTLISLTYFFKVVAPIVMLFIGKYYFSYFKNYERAGKILAYMLVVPLVGAYLQMLGLLQYQGFEDWIGGETVFRTTGFYHDPITMLVYFYVSTPFLLDQIFNKKRKILLILLILSIPVVFYSFSRHGIIAYIIQIIVWFYLNGNKKLAFNLLLSSVLFVSANEIIQLLYSEQLAPLLQDESGAAMHGRWLMWEILFGYFFNDSNLFQLLFGQGFMNVPYILLKVNGPIAPQLSHSEVVRVIIENGIIGFIIYVLLYFHLFVSSVKQKNENKQNQVLNRFSINFLILILPFFVLNFTANPTFWPSYNWPIWFMAGTFWVNKNYLMKQNSGNNNVIVKK